MPLSITKVKGSQRKVVARADTKMARVTHVSVKENTKMSSGHGECGLKPDEEVARELGGEVVMDYLPPEEGKTSCVVMSTQGEPWWEEVAWACGCKIVTHVVVGEGASLVCLDQAQRVPTTKTKGWNAGWDWVRAIEPSVVLVEGRLAGAGLRLTQSRPR